MLQYGRDAVYDQLYIFGWEKNVNIQQSQVKHFFILF